MKTRHAKYYADELKKREQDFDDEVSLCEYVSRKMGAELTLDQATKILALMNPPEPGETFRMSIRVTRPAGCNVQITADGWTREKIIEALKKREIFFAENQIIHNGLPIAVCSDYMERDDVDQDDYIDFEDEGDADETLTE